MTESATLLNNRYELIAQLGSGGMSVIYKAIDRELGRNVAVKVLRPSLTKDPSFLEKFRQEARNIANLQHPNIVTVHDVGSQGQTYYIVMEMVEGQDLKKIIRNHGALSVDRAVNIAVQMCAGLGYAHRSGIVHADVKPQNILVTRNDVVKVTDFGIAQALTDTQPNTRLDVVWGSPHYFAPEQAKGERPTPAADVYALGIVMFEMLTGRLPYIGATQQALAMAHINQPIPLITEYNNQLPESLARIVQKVMSKEPYQRYATADQLGNVLDQFKAAQAAAPQRAAGVDSQATFASPTIKPAQPQQPSQPQAVPGQPSQPMQQGGISRSPEPSVPRPPGSVDVTARYSPAPYAPQPYNPRQAQAPTIQTPQPQFSSNPASVNPPNYRAPFGGGAQSGSGSPFEDPYNSAANISYADGVDYVTVALAILAFIAIAGLVPLYLAVAAR